MNPVLAAIDFNDQPLFETNEVKNVGPERMLAAEFQTADLSQAKHAPECAFGFGHGRAELSRAGFVGTSPHAPIPAFPRLRGKGKEA